MSAIPEGGGVWRTMMKKLTTICVALVLLVLATLGLSLLTMFIGALVLCKYLNSDSL
jgi:hypothetical protein